MMRVQISLPAKPSLTRTMLGSARASRSGPAAPEPGLEPRVSGSAASAAPRGRPPLLIMNRNCHSLSLSLCAYYGDGELAERLPAGRSSPFGGKSGH
jgi:hypothetical protein